MIVFLNGQFVPDAEAKVSVFDRSFLYGDGLFETMRVFGGEPFCWAEHIERLSRGAEFLKIKIPHSESELKNFALELLKRNQMTDAILRITVSRGVGMRGYSPKGAEDPTMVMTLSSAQELSSCVRPTWRVITASCRLPADEPLAEFKTCNKLPQILARAEADAIGADEALLLNTRGEIVEAASSNLFWIIEGQVYTPSLRSGVLAGVTRRMVFKICDSLGLMVREASITHSDIHRLEGMFLSLSSWGVIEIISVDGKELARSPLILKIQAAYDALTLKRD